jgi:hypothetical protein
MPHRRTFEDAIVASSHSDVAGASPSWLRLAAYAGSRGTGNPSLSSAARMAAGQARRTLASPRLPQAA